MPLKNCVYLACKNNSDNYDKPFFHFPKNPERSRKWIEYCGQPFLKNKTPIYLSNGPCMICSEHFQRTDFCYQLAPYRTKLNRDVTPIHYKDQLHNADVLSKEAKKEPGSPSRKLKNIRLELSVAGIRKKGPKKYRASSSIPQSNVCKEDRGCNVLRKKNLLCETIQYKKETSKEVEELAEMRTPFQKILPKPLKFSSLVTRSELPQVISIKAKPLASTVHPVSSEWKKDQHGFYKENILEGTLKELDLSSREFKSEPNSSFPWPAIVPEIDRTPAASSLKKMVRIPLSSPAAVTQAIIFKQGYQYCEIYKDTLPEESFKELFVNEELSREVENGPITFFQSTQLPQSPEAMPRITVPPVAPPLLLIPVAQPNFFKQDRHYYNVCKENVSNGNLVDIDEFDDYDVEESLAVYNLINAKNQDLKLTCHKLNSLSDRHKSELDLILRESGKCLPPHLLAFFTSQLINAEREEKIWPPEVRKILAGLYSISPPAYRLLSDKLCFPIEDIVKKWTQQLLLDGSPHHSDSVMDEDGSTNRKLSRSSAIPECVADELAFENFMSTLI